MTHRIAFANQLRGLAALSVLIHHYFLIFFKSRDIVSNLTNLPLLSYQAVPTPAFVNAIDFYPFFDWGAFGVGLFFLISGFVVPFSLQKLTWQRFMFNRFFRIVPVYMIGFSITLVSVYLAGRYYHRLFPYHFKELFIHYVPGLRDVLRSTNIDGIVWTLEIEIKFYLLLALFSPLFKKNSLSIFLIPIVLGAFACYFNHKINLFNSHAFPAFLIYHVLSLFTFVSQYIIFMFIGVLFNYCYRKLISYEQAIFLMAVYFLLFSLVCYNGIYKASFPLTFSYAFAFVLFACSYANQSLFKERRFLSFFADISYPLYVIHGVAGSIVLRCLLENNCPIAMALWVTIATAISSASLLHYYVEKPLQHWVSRTNRQFIFRHTLRDRLQGDFT